MTLTEADVTDELERFGRTVYATAGWPEVATPSIGRNPQSVPDALPPIGRMPQTVPDALPPIGRMPQSVPDLAPSPAPRYRHTAPRGKPRAGDAHLPSPPDDVDRDRYLERGQNRKLLVVQYVAFLGVLISFLGFSTSSYWTLIFGIPLVLLVVEQSIALYTSTFARTIGLHDHKQVVRDWRPRQYPAVDVYLPTKGEELDLVENTMRYLTRLEWPGTLRICILDDSNRPEVELLTSRYGFDYLARPGSEFAKAGNLRFAAERTTGEFITILDADFVPRSDFLLELMPYFDADDVGIVQSPQFFDTAKHLNWVQRTAGATQEFFYRFVQPSRDRHGAAICVGSSAIYRRSALDDIGGFPRIKHSEDVFTGYEMGKRGMRTQYVPTVVSKGLCPDNLDSFVAQQYRWCEGSLTMLRSRDFHVNDALPLRARLSFWSGFLYYIGTAMNSLLLPLPAIIMVWFYPEWVRVGNMLWLVGVLLLWFILYPIVMTGRWRIEVLRLQTVYGFAHVFSIYHLLTGRDIGWHPTGSKKRPPLSVSVKRFYTCYLGLALLVLGSGLAYRGIDHLDRFWPMIAFSVLNVYIVAPLVWDGLRSELADRRKARLTRTGAGSARLDVAAG
jgi:cellulose synthase (UDP-forming)